MLLTGQYPLAVAVTKTVDLIQSSPQREVIVLVQVPESDYILPRYSRHQTWSCPHHTRDRTLPTQLHLCKGVLG